MKVFMNQFNVRAGDVVERIGWEREMREGGGDVSVGKVNYLHLHE